VEKGGKRVLRGLLWQVLGSALASTLSLAGMLWLVFDASLLDNVVIHHSTFTEIVSGSLLMITLLFGSGAIWGLGLGLVFTQDPKPIIKTTALPWGISAFLAAVILEIVNGFQVLLSQWLGTSRHFVFVTAFVLSVGIVVSWCAYMVLQHIDGSKKRRRAALTCGLLAAIAYFLVDRYMFFQGWVLGTTRIDGSSVMMRVMLNGVTAAALVGGGVLGWYLHHTDGSISST